MNYLKTQSAAYGGRPRKSILMIASVMAFGLTLPAAPVIAEEEGALGLEEIIVTARRIEENLQDVPVSMAVFKQEQLDDANITNINDLVRFTPSLGANARFGADSASFTIRGFAQEQRTTASVATYFGEVVAPRGGGTQIGGDGAGPGSFFDLQNMQVLNGPQGTLFGRNTTGGAVLLVPKRPTDKLEGYAEVSGGDFDMRRAQGVLNLPLGDRVKLRLGADTYRRDGYLKNQSPVGPDDFGDIDYDSFRASLLVDITPSIENYTIGTYMDSETHGSLNRILACTGNPFFTAPGGTAQVPASAACSHAALSGAIPSDRSASFNREGFYDVWNSVEEPRFENKVWQLQNTTTWQASDHLKIKNIISYGELEQLNRGDVNGTYLNLTALGGTTGSPFSTSGLGEAYKTTDQSTFSEELQFVGDGLDGRLNWQAGLYYEKSNPLSLTGSLSQTLWRCTGSPGSDPLNWTGCKGLGSARATLNEGSIEYENKAVYAQGDYEFTDALTLTLGVRYTWDHTSGKGRQFRWTGNTADGISDDIDVKECSPSVLPLGVTVAQNCELRQLSKTDAPTWTVGLNYSLTPENMLYTKYSRGYRQGSVNPFGPAFPVNLQTFEDEKVDAYEIGSKNSFDGAISGIFNVALFYNKLSDAQLLVGFVPPGASPTAAILNADRVTTYGTEVSGALNLFEGFTVNYAYSYLHTNVDHAPVIQPGATPSSLYYDGQDLFNAPENKVTVGATYRLPFLPSTVGEVSVGATWSYSDKQLISVVSNDGFNYLPSYDVMHVNLNWDGVFGSPFDVSVFVTNATDEQYNVYQTGQSTVLNFESVAPAPPRMYGLRVRYSFGGGG